MLFRSNIVKQFPQFPAVNEYPELLGLIRQRLAAEGARLPVRIALSILATCFLTTWLACSRSVVEDKLSMAQGLEVRVPFLDNDLVDYASNVPVWLKLGRIDMTDRVDENMPGANGSLAGAAVARAAPECVRTPRWPRRFRSLIPAPQIAPQGRC